jgi:imidazolonepropionase-like amidohydrolase
MIKLGWSIAILITFAASCISAQRVSSRQLADAVVAFVDVSVVPMDRERVMRNQTVIVRAGRITAMGSRNSVRVPKGALRIDGRGNYLMPGLADMHVHLEYFDREAQLLLFLANGVTTVRNMDGRPNILIWKQRIAAGTLIGPTIFTAGPILEGKPPFRDDNRVVESAAQAEAAVEEQKKAGYDFIKVYHTLSRDSYEAIIAAAKRQGLAVVGHVPRAVGLDGALAARQRSIEHLDGYLNAIEADDSPFRNRWTWLKLYFAVKIDDDKIIKAVQTTRQSGVWNVPTLVVRQKVAPAETVNLWLNRAEMRYLPPETVDFWRQSSSRVTQRMAPEDFERLAEGERVRRKLVRALRDAGAGLLLGSDTPNPFVIPGFSVHEELQNLVDSGLTPYQALSAGTRDAAEFLGVAAEIGTVAIGKRADLILVEGNPLESVANLSRRTGVMTRGHWYSAADLQKQLDALAASYPKR